MQRRQARRSRREDSLASDVRAPKDPEGAPTFSAYRCDVQFIRLRGIDLLRIAIVGLGPWGVCALERVVTTAREELRPGVDVAVHVIEPGTPGSGVYDVTQPDYLLLNNPCGQLSLYPFETEDYQPCYGVGLYDWAVATGYRWVGDRCAIDPAGQPIEPHHFLPAPVDGRVPPVVLSSADRRRAAERAHRAPSDLCRRFGGQARRKRGGAPGERRRGRRRPRDRHVWAHGEPGPRALSPSSTRTQSHSTWTRFRPARRSPCRGWDWWPSTWSRR